MQARRGIRIVLMLRRFLGLRLDVELAFEPDLLFVIHGQVQEFGEVIQLAFHVRVPQRRVTFASAPEHVTGAAQFVRDFQRLLHLRGGKGEGVGVATGGRAMHEPRIGEQIGRAPEQFDAGALLLFFQHFDHRVEIRVGLAQVFAFRRDVAVVEGVKRRAELFDELEGRPGAVLGVGHGVRPVVPRADGCAHAEGVGQRVAEGVPVHHGEAELFLHGFALDHLGGVVMFERQWISGFGPFEFDFRNVLKRGLHDSIIPS